VQDQCTTPRNTRTPSSLDDYRSLPGAETRIAIHEVYQPTGPTVDLTDVHMHGWAASQLFRLKPGHVLDIGGDAMFCGIMSQFCLLTTIDIWPWHPMLDGLTMLEGNILQLPYDNGSVHYVSCLSVAEHIGLGRYGDRLDALGSSKAFAELRRITAPGGHLLLAVPISHTPGLLWNAHRIFRRDQVLSHFPDFAVAEETCVYPHFGPPEWVASLPEWGYCMWLAHLWKGD
jgi:SAM-dependent methyltransferase